MSSYNMNPNSTYIRKVSRSKKLIWAALGFVITYNGNLTVSWSVRAKEKATSSMIAEQVLHESLSSATPRKKPQVDAAGFAVSPAKDKKDIRAPARVETPSSSTRALSSGVSKVISSGGDVVVALTDQGFIPQKLVMELGKSYEVYLVNLHERAKLSSFFIDEFAVQGTLPYSEIRKVTIIPKVVGEFFILSPETGALAQILVMEGR